MRRFLLVALALAACSSDPASPACTPGAQVACACVGGAQGAQACAASGSGYGACDCPDAGGLDVAPVDSGPGLDAAPGDVSEVDAGVDVSLLERGDTSPGPGDDGPAVDAGHDASLSADSDGPSAVDSPEPADTPEVGIACPMGLGDCDGDEANGCEADLRSNPAHCGGCGTVCRGAPNLTRPCRSGVCGEPQCASSFADCNNDLADGCEVNTFTGNLNNCGACGVVCPRNDAGQARCLNRQCL